MYPHARVSEILGMFRDYSSINQDVLQEKCAIGDETHQNIYLDSQDIPPSFDYFPVRDFKKKPELPIKSWERRGKPYFESYLLWKETNKPEYLIQEKRMFCDDLMITGQFDAVIKGTDKPVLIDYKCSATADEEIWGMQAHFYYYLLQQNGIEIDDTFFWLKLNVKKEGDLTIAKKPTVIEIKYSDEVMQKCIDAAVLYWELKSDARCVA